MNLHKKCTAEPYSFLVIHTTPASDNLLRFRDNLVERRGIEQAKFAYSPLGKAFEKQTKTIEDQCKKWIKAVEDHGKQLVASDKIRKYFNIAGDNIPLEEQKKYLMNLLKEDLLSLRV